MNKAGNLWLATELGLVEYDGSNFNRFTKEQGLSDNTVFCLLVDHGDRLWAGTANGLSCMDNGTLRTFKLAPDFGSNYIDLLVSSGDGRICWAPIMACSFCTRIACSPVLECRNTSP